ncbi:MAG: non-hydrolyzing UDP-N-acetylglucosamine 2-epimerase [Magnetovibrionaceae bacterium]
MSILTIVGARPQFIKAAPVQKAFKEAGLTDFLVHSGQHFDANMSDVFFDELGLRRPDFHLGVGANPPDLQLAEMIQGLNKVLAEVKPEAVVVFGDTTTTLAGTMSAIHNGCLLAHVEAGLRSYNRAMPEEYNRRLTDHAADLLFCPSNESVRNLASEGVTEGVHNVGDPMYDALLQFEDIIRERSTILANLGLAGGDYDVLTLHRGYTVDDPAILGEVMEAIAATGRQTVFPLHPRTRDRLTRFGLLEAVEAGPIRLLDPLGYIDMMRLVMDAARVLTDSGGLQKEAFYLGVPCITLRPETEWVETLEGGWNRLAGQAPETIRAAISSLEAPSGPRSDCYGTGRSAEQMAALLQAALSAR